MFLSFCLYTGSVHFGNNSSASHYLMATILVQVAVIFDLDRRRGLLAGFTASSLALFKLFSTDQPEGSCSNETPIMLLPAQSLPKVSHLTQSKIMHEPPAQSFSHV